MLNQPAQKPRKRLRSRRDIEDVARQYDDISFYNFMLAEKHRVEVHGGQIESEELWDANVAEMHRIEKDYDKDDITSPDEYHDGFIEGFLSCLEWVLCRFDDEEYVIEE
jgi:hypothetical protein